MTATRPRPTGTTPTTNLVEMAWDPVTRIVGSLGIYTKIDFDAREVVECHSTSSIFRGYAIFMKGKDPRDAHFITSRICGICGDNHATCSCYAQNMAYGVKPPHLACAPNCAIPLPSSGTRGCRRSRPTSRRSSSLFIRSARPPRGSREPLRASGGRRR